MTIARWRPELILLIIAGFITRLWSLFFPNAVVFDEVYFKVFASHYLDHKYFFDIHPPLGKLLLALVAYSFHLSPQAMQTGTALQLRLLPAVAGAMLVPVVWGILRRLSASRSIAFIGGLAIVLDNALLVESRFILVDSMLLLFGFSAVYFYLVYRQSKSSWTWLWLTLSAVTAGAAMSTKWTGLNAIAIILLLRFWDYRHGTKRSLKRWGELAMLIAIPVLIYLSVFWIHFHLLTLSGDGDAFMTPKFQSTLVGNPYYNPHARMSFLAKFIELNKEMYVANQTLTATHPYGSHWYMWPLEVRPIYYWEGTILANGTQGNIYLLGNPAVWWGVWIAILGAGLYMWSTAYRVGSRTANKLKFLGAAYLVNFLPFTLITRIMFLYHYLFALIFSILFVCVLWDDIIKRSLHKHVSQRAIQLGLAMVIVIMAAGFLYFAPLSYGSPMTPQQLEAHMWLKSWR